MLAFIPKEHPDLPDTYFITIHYNDYANTKETIEIAQHKIYQETMTLEICTKDDLWEIIPVNSFKKISLDKSFSKILAINQQIEIEKKRKAEELAKQNLLNKQMAEQIKEVQNEPVRANAAI